MGFSFFQYWKHPWIYLDFCGYMLCYFTPLWIYIHKQTSTPWHPIFFVTTLRNQYKKVAFIQMDEYLALTRYSELMKTCHNMNRLLIDRSDSLPILENHSWTQNPLKHDIREVIWDINGWTSGNFSWLGQEINMVGFFQVRDILGGTLHESFSWHLYYVGNQNTTKALIGNLLETLFWEVTDSWYQNILVYFRVDFENFYL